MKQETSVIKKSSGLAEMDEKKITIEGMYSIYYPFPDQKGKNDAFVIEIKLDGNEGVFLEPYWSEKSKRSEAEINKFKGKKVRVSGVYHQEQPKQPGAPDDASSFGGSCISPVDTISLAE